MGLEPPGKIERALMIGSDRLELRRGRDFDEHGRNGDGCTDPAEPSPQISAEIEHAEMQACGRLDEDRSVHDPATARGAART